jgi:mono/diheme cytochrome c family protein
VKRARGLIAAWLSLMSVGLGGAVAGQSPQARQQPPDPAALPYRAALNQYCVTCHNQRARTAGLGLDTMDLARVSDSAEVWEKVVRKLRTGTMPPQGARRPDQATYSSLISWLETELDRGAAARPGPGRAPLFHRLNRAEYGNAIRDLLALDVNVASLLPPDDSAYGFDNIADALGVSPLLLERYLVAADKVASLAVGDPDVSAGSETYRVRQDLSQDQHIEGMPLGTVGGALVHHTFPVDGEYEFQVKLFRTNSSVMRGLEYPQQLEITVDGERVYLVTIGGGDDFKTLLKDVTAAGDAVDARLKVKVRVKAGPRSVGVAFLYRSNVAESRALQPFLRSSVDTYDFTGRPHVDTFTIVGPFNAKGPGETPSRRRIFTCRPTSTGSGESACARQIVSTLARRAFRRPVTESDLQPLLEFYELGRREGTFETGIQLALQRMLASPMFVFRFERDPANVAPGAIYAVDDFELASQLSFFLWSSIPDDELLAAAGQGRLKIPSVREQQVRRMLADPRSRALVSNFAGQWLQLRNLKSIVPNSEEFSDFDDNLRQAFQIEAEMFFESIMREDRNVLDLMTADYTFVNERLARHYGIPNVYGSHFRRVTLTDEARIGLLGKGGVLLVTSHTDRTSPVVRGKWILENLLGTPPPPPPPDVPPFPENTGQKPRSVRDRMEQHRANPTCAACHKLMDPLGFALENFDAVGKWRTRDAGSPIDASGQLTDGTPVDGVVSLRLALSRRPDVFVGTLTEKLMTYALGRGLDYRDMPAVRAVLRESQPRNYRFSSLVLGIVNSPQFRMRVKAAGE